MRFAAAPEPFLKEKPFVKRGFVLKTALFLFSLKLTIYSNGGIWLCYCPKLPVLLISEN
jgi:hypothetical protein